jgi:hypothetical protein
VHTAFLEDLAVIQAQQENMSLLDGQLPPQMDFNQDAGGLQARRILDAILAREMNTRAERASV